MLTIFILEHLNFHRQRYFALFEQNYLAPYLYKIGNFCSLSKNRGL